MRLAAARSVVGTTAATIMLAARPVSRSAATTAREVKVVFGRLRRRIRALALVDDLSGSQAAVLTRLHKDVPLRTSVLARAEAASHQAIGAILAVLDERGFIQRSPDPTDGRRQLISLTDAGLAQAETPSGHGRTGWPGYCMTDLAKTNAQQCGMRWDF